MADNTYSTAPVGPTVDARRVRRASARAARSYEDAAVLQREVGRRLLERLDLVRLVPQRVLDLGCGTGMQARELARRYPDAVVTGVDLSPQMLQAAPDARSLLDRLRGRHAWQRVAADMARLPFADGVFDLAWSNLALEWSNRPERVFDAVRRCLRPEGLFMFTTIGPDTLKELRRAAPDLAMQPTTDMHNVGDALVKAGFSAPVVDMETITLTYPHLLGLFADLRACASTCALPPAGKGLRGRSWLAALSARYEAARSAGRLPATVEVIYGHAWRPTAERAMPDPAAPRVIRVHRRERPR